MESKNILKRIAFLIVFIFLLNYLAMKFYWYTSIWYFDMILHFMGGFWLALVFMWIFIKDISLINLDDIFLNKNILKIFFGVFLFGIFWEIFEILVNDLTIQNPFNTLDTISDMFFDLAGGFFCYFLVYKNIINSKIKSL